MSTQNTVEVIPDSKEWRLTLAEPVTVKFSENRPLERKKEQDVETGQIVIVTTMDEYPDGGLAAWSVVLGVGEFAIALPSKFTDEPCSHTKSACAIFAT